MIVRFFSALLCGALLALPARAGVVISEFLAENEGGLHDADGDSPDWIELHNTGAAPVNLGGWHLTDNATNLTKWTFPQVVLQPGSYLLVFASGKNRTNDTSALHTSFQLEQSGGYIALVEANGTNIAHAITYGNQRVNVSFGIGSSNSSATVLTSTAAAKWFVPSDGAVGVAWTALNFDDSAWSVATSPLRYDVVAGGGPVLSLDVNARSGDTAANTETGFTSFTMSAASGTQLTPTTRTYGGLSVTLSNSNPTIAYDDRLRASPSNGGSFTLQNTLRDFIFSRDATTTSGLDVYIGGLAANQPYDITIWSFDASSAGSRISDWYANGVLLTNNYTFNGSVLPTNDTQYRFTLRSTANDSGGILVSGRRDATSVDSAGAASFGVFLNALQVTPLNAAPVTNGNVAALAGNNSTLYARFPFTVPDPSLYDSLTLRMRYDDGFIAYLNGVEIARRNAPASPNYNSAATTTNSAAVAEEINLPGAASILVAGTNVLAIRGLNITAGDADFFIQPELVAVRSADFPDRYFAVPTPGAANNTGYVGLVADTKFSMDRGFYDTNFSLSISCATPGAQIRYTFDGSAPTPSNGLVFTSPIAVSGQSFVRAAAFFPGYIPANVDTHSYIFLRDVLRQSNNIPGYPTQWQASYIADYAMDSNIVNHPVYGATLSNDLRSIATLCIVSEQNGMWNSSTGMYPNPTSIGTAWERAASLELIAGSGKSEFATTAKIQIHGNASRDNVRTPKHAIGVAFSSDYGPAKLRYDWFGGGVKVHDKIVLRGCGFVDGWSGRYADNSTYTSAETGETFRGLRYRPENTCYLRDAWVKDSFRAMGWNSSRSAYVHLYINGLYWGLYEPSEHLDASYFAAHLGGDEVAWDVVVGEDNNGPPLLVDGSLTDWQNVLNVVNAGITSEAAYQAVAQLVDIDNLIDYMMLHIFAESEDWPRHNWYAAHRRATNGIPATKFTFTVWDQELTLDRLVRRNRINVGNGADGAGELYSPARVYAQLRAWPEFRVRFGDRVQKHLFNTGALTVSNNVARMLTSAAVIRQAVVGESARWGDARKTPNPPGAFPTGQTFTRDEWWQPEIDKTVTNFLQKLTSDNVARFRAGNLYPSNGAPQFNQFGGGVSNGFTLLITQTNSIGTIYFTTDGSDPREYGSGAVAGGAQAWPGVFSFLTTTLIRARVLSGTQWSALTEAVFYPPQDLTRLALTEIMYNPPAVGLTNGDEFEFIELKNTGTNTLNMSGMHFTQGVQFTFTNGSLLMPGQFAVLVRNAAAFSSKYPGAPIAGVYTGKLDNGGEELALADGVGARIFSVTFDDAAPWPVAPDGFGFSLVPRNPGVTQAPDDGVKWRASAAIGGSPATDDPEPSIAPIVINEILTHTDLPAVDRIELFNPTATHVDLSGWFLTDDPNIPWKYRIADGTNISPGGFVVFDESQFNRTPGTNNSFSLSSHGEQVYLFSGDALGNLTGYSHGFAFGGAQNGVSFGRYVNSVGEEQFPAQLANTFGGVNSGPRVGPVVINEVHYHPPGLLDPLFEYIELKNISPTNVPLFDPAYPTNTWRIEGADYTFPPNVTLPAGGLLLVISTNVTAFRAQYSVPANVPILGSFNGLLQDSGERLELKRPDAPDTNGVSMIVVDAVRYNDKAPWPAAADGGGSSLQRKTATAYGDDPVNWQAALPTPGAENAEPDSDGDGIPDAWEIANGTNPNVADAFDDPDGDGLNNGQEYLAGTNPNDGASVFQAKAVTRMGSSFQFDFLAASNHSYRVLFKTTLDGTWATLSNVPPSSSFRTITITDPATNGSRYYRLVTP